MVVNNRHYKLRLMAENLADINELKSRLPSVPETLTRSTLLKVTSILYLRRKHTRQPFVSCLPNYVSMAINKSVTTI